MGSGAGSFHLTSQQRHLAWDNSLPPALVVEAGDELTLELGDSSGGQLVETDDASALARFDMSRVNPCTGPVRVEGLLAGDDLVVSILAIEPREWAWTANIPGFGLLSDDFPDPHLWISKVHDSVVSLPIGVELPARPMIGTIGVAPKAAGTSPLLVPTEAGGNMDIAQLGAGTVLHLPAQVDGGLLSAGDAHAVQGDGEVCGTGAELAATLTVRVEVGAQGRTLQSPWFAHSAPPAAAAWIATTGIAPNLFEASRAATRRAVDLVVKGTGLAPVEAYLLLSLTGELRISEIVDVPNWVVSMHVPADIAGWTG
ncbi:formamidase [Jatrophihabitans sp. GAS493]|uniref:acetamidase/formamidase family protein n=1 Tax=Jatrophihabitans sp. GAS493 TaxID=1907575 RepID=UPI000BB80321|nr:acetamidase/formamidase family protein [Jatrophihabitans sp. GAS493]SOD74796.1 formamidase [Jatrophihabitans sp. GAS493]